ncbi:putative WD repeat-containing protein [Diplonema papillatum]|nr:putative WD repeat-containing protein [Diplonema papillatum]
MSGEEGCASKEVSLEKLKELKVLFDRASEGTLDEDEFIQAFEEILGDDPAQLKRWFRRIDANANGSVDWDEFSSFVLLDRNREDASADYTPLTPLRTVRSRHTFRNSLQGHKAQVTSVHILPNRALPHQSKVLTASADSTIKAWSCDSLHLEATLQMPGWVLSSKLTRNGRRMLASHTDKSISVVDTEKLDVVCVMGAKKPPPRVFESLGQIVDRPNEAAAASLEFLSRTADGKDDAAGPELVEQRLEHERERVMRVRTRVPPSFLPIQGIVDVPSAIEPVTLAPASALRWVASDRAPSSFDEKTLLLVGLKNGDLLFYPLPPDAVNYRTQVLPDHSQIVSHTFKWSRLHDNCISAIKWGNTIDNVITGSWDGTVKFLNAETCRISGVLSSKERSKSIFGMQWNGKRKVLATHGSEPAVYLWNPHMATPIAVLPHPSPVKDVAENLDKHLVLVLTEDKLVKVWDIRTLKCVQTLKDDHLRGVTKIALDATTAQLAICSTRPTVWNARPTREEDDPWQDRQPKNSARFDLANSGRSARQKAAGHRSAVKTIMRNRELKNSIVSTDGYDVITWSLLTGRQTFRFSIERALKSVSLEDFGSPQASGGSHAIKADGTATAADREAVAVTSVILDAKGRRLVTGLHNGLALLWNYVTGQLLKVCHTRPVRGGGRRDVSAVAHLCYDDFREIYGAVGAELYVWADTETPVSHPSFAWHFPGPRGGEYIVEICTSSPWRLLLGTSMGRITVFNAKTRKATTAFERLASVLPLSNNADTLPMLHHMSQITEGVVHPVVQHIHVLQDGPATTHEEIDQSMDDNYIQRVKAETEARRLVAVTYVDQTVEVWDVRCRRMLCHWNVGGKRSASMCVTGHGNGLLTGDDQGRLQVWDIEPTPNAAPQVKRTVRFDSQGHGDVTAVVAASISQDHDDDGPLDPTDAPPAVYFAHGTARGTLYLHSAQGVLIGEFGGAWDTALAAGSAAKGNPPTAAAPKLPSLCLDGVVSAPEPPSRATPFCRRREPRSPPAPATGLTALPTSRRPPPVFVTQDGGGAAAPAIPFLLSNGRKPAPSDAGGDALACRVMPLLLDARESSGARLAGFSTYEASRQPNHSSSAGSPPDAGVSPVPSRPKGSPTFRRRPHRRGKQGGKLGRVGAKASKSSAKRTPRPGWKAHGGPVGERADGASGFLAQLACPCTLERQPKARRSDRLGWNLAHRARIEASHVPTARP